MHINIESLAAYGDAVAIIGFAMLVVYFYKKVKRNRFENILYLFVCIGLIVDTFLTIYRISN